MHPYDYIDTDLRNWKCGGWNASKMTVKVNGRWSYIYSVDSSTPKNVKEPISLDSPYTPPNHKNEPFEVIYTPKTHPLRKSALQQRTIISKAPICYLDNHNLASSQKVTLRSSLQETRPKLEITSKSLNPIENQKSIINDNEIDYNPTENHIENEKNMNCRVRSIPFWSNNCNNIKDLRERTALDSRMRKRDQIRLKQIRRSQQKPRPPTSSFTSSDTIIRDDSVLQESKKLLNHTHTPLKKRIFYVC